MPPTTNKPASVRIPSGDEIRAVIGHYAETCERLEAARKECNDARIAVADMLKAAGLSGFVL